MTRILSNSFDSLLVTGVQLQKDVLASSESLSLLTDIERRDSYGGISNIAGG
jgi:hypothetical protein